MITVIIIPFFVLAFVVWRYRLLVSAENKLPVLMYHKVSLNQTDYLTVTAEQLDNQMQYLKKQGYWFVTMDNLHSRLRYRMPWAGKAILITFDDAYQSTLDLAYPILKKHGVKATIFVPTFYIGWKSNWDDHPECLMSLESLKTIDRAVFELGLHSHKHINYGEMDGDELVDDFIANLDFFKEHGISHNFTFAYPYGGWYKDSDHRRKMKAFFVERYLQFAFRIGNTINRLPRANEELDLGGDYFEMTRIDIRGTDSFNVFRWKVKFGRFNPF